MFCTAISFGMDCKAKCPRLPKLPREARVWCLCCISIRLSRKAKRGLAIMVELG